MDQKALKKIVESNIGTRAYNRVIIWNLDGVIFITNTHWMFRLPEDTFRGIKWNRNKVEIPRVGECYSCYCGDWEFEARIPGWESIPPKETKPIKITPFIFDGLGDRTHHMRPFLFDDGTIVAVQEKYIQPWFGYEYLGVDEVSPIVVQTDHNEDWTAIIMPMRDDKIAEYFDIDGKIKGVNDAE